MASACYPPRMRRVWIPLALLAAAGCGPDYYCSEFDDATGRPVVFCSNPRAEPVCDLPGDEARFEEDPEMGLVLVGAERAECSSEREVVCPMGTVGDPYCIIDPEL